MAQCPQDAADPPGVVPATVEVTRGDGALALLPQYRLQVEQGPDAGAALLSKSERTVIGSHESCDLVLQDRTVSRFHCEIARRVDRLVVRDLGSRNGTVINGVSILEGHLRSGCRLKLGDTLIHFEMGPDRVAIPVSSESGFGKLVGRSLAMRAAYAALERASASDATILLRGETGVGKDIAAQSVHAASRRAEGPFVTVDCGALPPTLIESELFGHEKGAYTGAVAPHEGALVAASGGTLFLDEIGELALDLQPKLLRALEQRIVRPVGGNRDLPFDVRIIAASNRNLRAEVNAGRFRPDLFYRLAVVEIFLPPLRERLDDLAALVDHFLDGYDPPVPAALRARLCNEAFLGGLRQHSWPGNVRELRNYLERCLALDEQLPPPEGPKDGTPLVHVDETQPLKRARERWNLLLERHYVAKLLTRHNNNVTAAARAAGIDRIHLHRLLRRHGLR
jgi:transcriptional regulator with PAS, ATPase and Fis domain